MIKKLLIALCLLLVVQAAVHKLSVKKLGSRSGALLKAGKPSEFRAYRQAHQRNYKAHLNRVKRGRKNSRAGRLASQPLYDYYDQAYTVAVGIGTPAQQFNLLLDTFLGDTWVPDATCDPTVCGCTDADDPSCTTRNTFDSSKSSTYKVDGRPFTDNNTQGTGFLGIDNIQLGSDLTVTGVTFGQVDNPFQYIKYYPFDGFLGLTFQSSDGVEPVIQAAVDQKLLDAPIFTLYLKSDGFDSAGQVGGQITYGSVDSDHCSSDVSYTPVLSQNLWEFEVQSTEIGGKTRKGNGWTAFADPSSTIIGLNNETLSDIVAATGATFNTDYGLYQVDCNIQFQWTVTLGGSKFVVDQSNTLYNVGDFCLLMFESFVYPGIDFLLGGPFVQDYCLVYDVTGNLGFSKITV
ncbi:putative aspartyle protease [Aphelenchoides bicaudatus]|nr:putative aspartyle protease [Aphelenchoides bicaudatus]